MQCPNCGSDLAEQREGLYEDIVFQACTACGGALYPRGAVDRLDDSVVLDAEELEYELLEEIDALPCPVCRDPHGYRERGGGSMVWCGAAEVPELRVAICEDCDAWWMPDTMLARVRELVLARSSESNADLNAHNRRWLEQEKAKRGFKRRMGK
jgi:hypothetical protein